MIKISLGLRQKAKRWPLWHRMHIVKWLQMRVMPWIDQPDRCTSLMMEFLTSGH